MYIIIVDVTVEIDVEKHETSGNDIAQETTEWFEDSTTIDNVCNVHVGDPCNLEIADMKEEMSEDVRHVQVSIISPLVSLTWMYLCKPFRDILDFNFTRDPHYNGDFVVRRFNDTTYVQKHQLWDWHEFILLANGSLLYKGAIIRESQSLYYVKQVNYEIPDYIENAENKNAYRGHHDYQWFFPVAVLKCSLINESVDQYVIEDRILRMIVRRQSGVTVVDTNSLQKPLVDSSGDIVTTTDELQHADVKNNKPFFFVILGFDKYHHTSFTSKTDWQTHGVYWWIGNMQSDLQFSKQLTFTMGQIPESVKLNTIGRLCYSEWIKLMRDGALIWTGSQMDRVKGMISHQITDLEDRSQLMRRRGVSNKSRCDGMMWLGTKDGCQWPQNVQNMLELNVVAPGPYLLKLWQHWNRNCNDPQLWGNNFASNQGFKISLNECKADIYNELPIASSLKSTVELNHTTLLGCTKKAFTNEWYYMHRKNNLNETMTRDLMALYLYQYVDNVNGIESIVAKKSTKLNVWNSMHNSWNKLVEIAIALPNVIDWFGTIGLVISIIRITGALFNITTDNERDRIQNITIPVLAASLVITCPCIYCLFNTICYILFHVDLHS